MRKLAREAVIFMLLTSIVAFVGSFAYLYHDARKPVVADTSTVHGTAPLSDIVTNRGLPPGAVVLPIPCTDGDKYISEGRIVWSCQKGVQTWTVNYDKLAREAGAIDPYAGLVQKSTSESDPFADIATPVGRTNTPTAPAPASKLLGDSLLLGLYGFPAGLVLWTFYRVVRFAIKG